MQLPSCATLLLPLVLALMGSAALAAPAVMVSPAGNHPRGTTKVSGTGFGASEQVDIYFDTTDKTLVTADASGDFGPRTIVVSADALPGTHWVSAVGRTTSLEGQHAFRVRTNWDSHGFDAVGQRRNPYENVISAANAGNLQLAWMKPTDFQIGPSSPAVAQVTGTYNPYIFIQSAGGYLYAFDSTGRRVWKKYPRGGTSPAVDGTTVYAGGTGGLYAFKAATGAPAWPSPASTGGNVGSSPAIANGIVYVGCSDGNVYAFHASDGTPAWPSPAVAGGPIYNSSPAVANGMVYVGSSDGKMYAFDANTGAKVWSFTASTDIESSPAVADGMVYFGSGTPQQYGDFYAVDARTGQQKWTALDGGLLTSSVAVANGVVYVGFQGHYLWALRGSDGTALWGGYTGDAIFYSSPAVANGVVYVGTRKYYLKAFNADGCGYYYCQPLWTAKVRGILSSPTISDGMLYIGGLDDNLYAFALNGGNNPAYAYRKNTTPPSRVSLHPDIRLKPTRH